MTLDTSHLIAIAAALGWASGLRLYAVLFLTGAAGALGLVPLPDGLKILQNPWMLGGSGLLLLVEFFADKIPGVDTLWDAVHTLVRIPAGAALAAAVKACKRLVQDVAGRPVDAALRADTARRIADIRASYEGREGVQAFLNKRKPAWLEDPAP